MTLTEILKNRRSVRKFASEPLTRETIEGLLALAFTAPSSKNARSTRFMVVSEPETLTQISTMRDFGSAFIADAPCGVLVLGDASATDLWIDNAAISATILQLAATDAGLASCWVHVNGRPRWSKEPEGGSPTGYNIDLAETAPDYLRTFLPIPADWHPLCFVALGYPADPVKPRNPKDDGDKVVWL